MAKKIFAALGIVGFLATAGIAFAQTTTDNTGGGSSQSATATVAPRTQPMVLEVNSGGRVLLRGTVDTASANSLTIKGWGGNWTVNVSANTEVMPKGAAVSSLQQGDFVGILGTVDQSSSWTIDATLVRDWTARQALNQEVKTNVQAVRQEMSAAPRTIQGTLSNLDATAQTFTLTNAGGTAYAVSLTSGAKILARNWLTLDFSKVSNGDTVRVYGTVASSTITASIFRDVSVR
ncbi:hypothetical protein KGQ25_01660 [Patescibacteria group bacterium]|nr:hypothetical protein [Patescibacteria group bacterium]MDE2021824.1 hypothetical protein [Patescibacteria group bacterium]